MREKKVARILYLPERPSPIAEHHLKQAYPFSQHDKHFMVTTTQDLYSK